VAAVAVLAARQAVGLADDAAAMLRVLRRHVGVADRAVGARQFGAMRHGRDPGVTVGAGEALVHAAGETRQADLDRVASRVLMAIGTDRVGDVSGQDRCRRQGHGQSQGHPAGSELLHHRPFLSPARPGHTC
jgi:hypothetical protein